jgi:hypothetical protein
VSAGDEHGEVVGIGPELVGDHVGELLRLLQLWLQRGVGGQDSLILARHGPQFELGRVTANGRDIDLEAGLHEMVQGKQHLDRVIAGGEHPAVLQQDVALLGGDHQDPPLTALVFILVPHSVEVGLRRYVQTQ